MAIKDLAITSLETITVFTLGGDYLFTLDELQNASIAQGQEKVDITGKQGRKITSLKRNKTVTVSGTNGIVSGGLLHMQVGGEGWSENGNSDILWTDTTLKVTESGEGTKTYTATLAYAPISVEDGGFIEIYEKRADGSLGKKVELDTTISEGKFTLSGTTVTFFPGATGSTTKPADFAAGQELVAYYKRTVSAVGKLENMSDKYSEKGQVFIDAIAEDKCGNVYHVQYYIPKGDFNGEFEFSMGDDQTVHAFEIEALAGGCNGSSAFWTLTVFGEEN